MLRNCQFAVAEVLFDLGRFEESLKAYTAITTRYADEPEVLEAFLQVASVYQRLDKPNEARVALRQAKAVLDRLKDDAAFTRTTNYTRKQWSELLESMINS